MNKATYVQQGNSLDYRNDTTKPIEAGTILPLFTRVGVAGTDIPAKGDGSVHVVGVFLIAKKNTDKLEMGESVYFNTTDNVITKTADGNIPAGYAVKSAEAADGEVLVKLLG